MKMRHPLLIPGVLALFVLSAAAQQAVDGDDPLTAEEQAAVNSPEGKQAAKDVSKQVAEIQAKAEAHNRAIEQRLNEIDKSINTITRRLGDNYSAPTAFNSVERRIGDIEKRLDRMERELRSATRR